MSDATIPPEKLQEIAAYHAHKPGNVSTAEAMLLALMRWLAQPEPGCISPKVCGKYYHALDCPVTDYRDARAPYTAILRGEG